MELLSFLEWLGQTSFTSFWLPIGLWTLTAIPLFLLSKSIASKFPQVHYHGSVALLLSLPLGFLMAPLLVGEVTTVTTAADIPAFLETAIVEAPQIAAPAFQSEPSVELPAATNSAELNINGNTITGVLTLFVLLIGLLGITKLIYRWMDLRHLQHQMYPAKAQTALSKLAELREQLGIKQDVLLMHGPPNMTPLTYGWKKPVIVIPDELTTEPQTLEATLLHELVHVKQRDYIVGLWTKVIKAVFTFHPLVLLLEREARIFRELSCDSEILEESAISPADYARLLLRFNTPRENHYFVPMISGKSILKQRIKALAHDRLKSTKTANRARLFVFPMLLMIPAVFMACNIEKAIEYPSDPDVTVFKDIGVSIKVPKHWVEAESKRRTQADGYEGWLESTPQNVVDFLDHKEPDHPDELTFGQNSFIYTDVTDENFPEFLDGSRTFFRFTLTIDYFRRKSPEARRLWREGKCNWGGEEKLCADSRFAHSRLVRQLKKEEMPFEADSGFLTEFDFFSLEDVSVATNKQMGFTFYKVKGEICYKIRLRAVANSPEKIDTIQDLSFLEKESITEMLSSIRFY